MCPQGGNVRDLGEEGQGGPDEGEAGGEEWREAVSSGLEDDRAWLGKGGAGCRYCKDKEGCITMAKAASQSL